MVTLTFGVTEQKNHMKLMYTVKRGRMGLLHKHFNIGRLEKTITKDWKTGSSEKTKGWHIPLRIGLWTQCDGIIKYLTFLFCAWKRTPDSRRTDKIILILYNRDHLSYDLNEWKTF